MTLTGQAPTIRPAEQRISAASLGAGKVYPQRESRGSLAGTTGVRAPSLSGRERGGTIQSPERGGQTGRASGERGIGAGDSSRRSGPQGDQRRGSIRKNAFGYPSSPEISVRKYGQTIQGSRSSSVRSRFYSYIQGNRSSSRSSSARGSSSRGSISSSRSRGSSSSGSRGSISSGSRGGFSGGSHSSGSRSSGGGIRHRG